MCIDLAWLMLWHCSSHVDALNQHKCECEAQTHNQHSGVNVGFCEWLNEWFSNNSGLVLFLCFMNVVDCAMNE